eukprot:8638385-Pyramimonas_sp.AAC.1
MKYWGRDAHILQQPLPPAPSPPPRPPPLPLHPEPKAENDAVAPPHSPALAPYALSALASAAGRALKD